MSARKTWSEKLLKHARGHVLECWIWPKEKKNGYGVIRGVLDGKRIKKSAHRVSYEHFNGPVPAGLMVLHHCDTPACFNPNHLYAGTAVDNMADCVNRGRKPKIHIGCTQRDGRISASIVQEIRSLYVPRKITYRALGKRYGVSHQLIMEIVHFKIWRPAE